MLKRNFSITFDKDRLNKLVLDERSCVTLKHCTHHLALHPYHLNNVTESLKYILNKGIAKYDSVLNGILLGYQNIKLLSTAGSIHTDACFIHVDISADFFLFKPDVGKSLTGVVNKKSEDHVGCLVHETFNVSLPKPPDEDAWIGSVVQIGQEILLQINLIDLEGRLPYIRGTFISMLTELDSGISTGDDAKSIKSKKKSKAKKLIFSNNSDDENVIDPEIAQKKKKKKSKRSKENYSDETSYEEPNISQLPKDTEETCFKNTKKHKKRKIKDETDLDIETSYEEVIASNSSINNNSKKRKRKHNTVGDFDIKTSFIKDEKMSKSSHISEDNLQHLNPEVFRKKKKPKLHHSLDVTYCIDSIKEKKKHKKNQSY